MDSKRQIFLVDTTISRFSSSGKVRPIVHTLDSAAQLSEMGVDIIHLGQMREYSKHDLQNLVVDARLTKQDFMFSVCADARELMRASETAIQHISVTFSAEAAQKLCIHSNFREELQRQSVLMLKTNKQCHWVITLTSWRSIPQLKHFATIAQHASIPVVGLKLSCPMLHPKHLGQLIQAVQDVYAGKIRLLASDECSMASCYAIAAIDHGTTMIDVCVNRRQTASCDFYSVKDIIRYLYAETLYCRANHIDTHTLSEHAGAKMQRMHPTTHDMQASTCYHSRHHVKKPYRQCASVLPYHQSGIGTRWLLADQSIDFRTPFYISLRRFDSDESSNAEPHVEMHAHSRPCYQIFMGSNPDGTGLKVQLSEQDQSGHEYTKTIESPASVLIPPRQQHTYTYIEGTGYYIIVLLSPNYTDHLLGSDE